MNGGAPDFEYFSSSRCTQQQQQQVLASFLPPPGFQIERLHQKPRKKRSKVLRVDGRTLSGSHDFPRPKPSRKPDPGAPKITRPCTECGKKFWSWKALFGHMRCHPERQWRGINPPANLLRPVSPETTPSREVAAEALTEQDHDVAASLLMLANGPSAFRGFPEHSGWFLGEETVGAGGEELGANGRFECSSCKKVFGSHQALGGHRASHKNVKGCFAITRSDGEDSDMILGLGEDESAGGQAEDTVMGLGQQHKCIICLKVFSSGQALGGHKRRHWEKGEDQSLALLPQLGQSHGTLLSPKEGFGGLDLNLPAPLEDEASSSSHPSGLALDLRLGI